MNEISRVSRNALHGMKPSMFDSGSMSLMACYEIGQKLDIYMHRFRQSAFACALWSNQKPLSGPAAALSADDHRMLAAPQAEN
jgi:hypothetical protein